jgi:hypothetical protein
MNKILPTRRTLLQTAAVATPALAATSVRGAEGEPNVTTDPTSKRLHKPISDRICVLYNLDGHILHTHREVIFPGARNRTGDELEARARELARARGHDIGALNALRFERKDPSSVYRSFIYRVDVATKTLVSLDAATDAIVS